VPLLAEFTPPVASPGRDESLPLPNVVTICRERESRRCWIVEGAGDCVGGAVFLVVPAADAEDAARRCREP
jgi:hypothetical protein